MIHQKHWKISGLKTHNWTIINLGLLGLLTLLRTDTIILLPIPILIIYLYLKPKISIFYRNYRR